MLAVVVFMVASYGLFGLFANIALGLNMALIFAALSILGGTLTLPGIAGIVLTIGMAVDANVLVFERIREELRGLKNPARAIEIGYERALVGDHRCQCDHADHRDSAVRCRLWPGARFCHHPGDRHSDIGVHGDLRHALDHRVLVRLASSQDNSGIERAMTCV